MSVGLGSFGTTEGSIKIQKKENVVIAKSRTVTANYIKTHQKEECMFNGEFSLGEAELVSLGHF